MVLNTDGSYSYTLDNSNPTIQGLVPGETLADSFDYNISDGHGGTSSATLTITIHGSNDGVTITDLTPAAQGGEVTVNEANLSNGTLPNIAALTSPSANFSVSAPDGLTSVKISGVTIYNGVSFSPIDVVTVLGVLHITGFAGNATGGTFTYTYTLQDNALVNGTQSFENLNVEVRDIDGSTALDLLSVRILDDAPLLNITNGIAQNSTDTSLFGTLANMGADQDGAHISLSLGSMPSGLSSGGVGLSYTTSVDGSLITAKAGANTVFTLTAGSDGSYVYHQTASLDLTILSTDLQSSVGAGGPQSAYYFYTDSAFGSVENYGDWVVKITGSGNINPSTIGMGVSNNLFQTGETMHFEFDDEHASSVGGNAPNLVYIAKIGVAGLDGNETLQYTAYYTDGTHSASTTLHSTDLVSGAFFVNSPDGKYLDYIDLAAGSNTSVRLNAFTSFVQDDTQVKDLHFNFTATDGDTDAVSGGLTVTVTNSHTLSGASANDAIGGGTGMDTLSGGSGSNIMTGGAGDDTMTGGAGSDKYTFLLGNNAGQMQMQGNDKITDTSGTENTLEFHNVLDVAGPSGLTLADLNTQATFTDTGVGNADLKIAMAGGGSLTLAGYGNQNIHNFTDLDNTAHWHVAIF